MIQRVCALRLGADQRELEVRGTPLFPCSAYLDEVGTQITYDVPWHWHPEIEAVLVADGAAEVSIGDRRSVIRAGGGFFCNQNVLHSLAAFGETPCTLHSLVFDPVIVSGAPESVFAQNYVRPLLENRGLGGLFLDPAIPWQGGILDCIESAYRAIEGEAPGYEFTVRDRLSALWLTILEHHGAQLPVSVPYTRETERLKLMLSYIQDHLTARLTVSEIADRANICVRECQRCFEKALHTSPSAYVLRCRVARAAGLLAETDRSMTEIAMETGFVSPSYFSKRFREQFGMSPSAYRASQLQSREDGCP